MELDDLQRHIDQVMNEQNNRSIPEFEGYSPAEMHKILNYTFVSGSPLKLRKLSDSDYNRIPMLNQIKYLMDLIDKNGELKLTNKGYLPTKVVSDLYQQRFIKDELIEKGISKLYKETDSISVNLTRILMELAGLVKKRNGKISLTKSSKKMLQDNEELLRRIFLIFATKFNWAYYDGYGENQIGQFGYGFSLVLLAKYGEKKRLDSFYAEKYFMAFPGLLDLIEPTYGAAGNSATRCYSIRTFDRFLDYFGLIKIDREGNWIDSTKHITKTDLFDRLIEVQPHTA